MGVLGVDPVDLGPAVLHEIDTGLLAGDTTGEVLDPFGVPPWLETLEPFDVGGAVVAHPITAGVRWKT